MSLGRFIRHIKFMIAVSLTFYLRSPFLKHTIQGDGNLFLSKENLSNAVRIWDVAIAASRTLKKPARVGALVAKIKYFNFICYNDKSKWYG